jgi:tetratricopeptide (TPR) repeat protein
VLAFDATPAAARRANIAVLVERYHALHAAGDYRAALHQAEMLEASVKAQFGTKHANYATVLDMLAKAHEAQGHYGEAELVLKQSLALKEGSKGQKNVQVAKTLNLLANLYAKQGRYADAEPLSRRALEMAEKERGAGRASLGPALNGLANIFIGQGRYDEAEALQKRALAIVEKSKDSANDDYVATLGNLAAVHYLQGRFGEAETLFLRAVALKERARGAGHPDLAKTLNNLANVYNRQGKFGEAESRYRQALTIAERSLGANHPQLAVYFANLASVYRTQGRYAEAEGLYQRALALDEAALGPNHPETALILNNLGNLLFDQGRTAEAEGTYKRALAIREKALGTNHPEVGVTLDALAGVYRSQGKYREAEDLLKRALAITEPALGAGHAVLAPTLNKLGDVNRLQGRHGEAARLYDRALTIIEQSVGGNHPDAAALLDKRAMAEAAEGNLATALAWSRRATSTLIAHAGSEQSAPSRPAGQQGGLITQRADYFVRRMGYLAVASQQRLESEAALRDEAIEIAQWASLSSAASAVQQMGVRFAAGRDALASLIRENQDLAAAWRDRDKALIEALSKPEGQRNSTLIANIRRQIAETERKLAVVTARLEKEFPDFAALARPKPLQADEAQQLLRADEALVFFLAGDRESHVFALTRERFEWRTIPLGAKDLGAKIAAFRRGLDLAELERSINAGRAELFDLAFAYDLYVALFGPVEAFVKDKRHLLVVPSGPLTGLPFHLLVTEKPAAGPEIRDSSVYRNAAWLIKRHAITVLPSVGSLKALRVFAGKEQGGKVMIGFGDPVFESQPSPTPVDRRHRRARATERTRAYSDFWRGPTVDRGKLAEALASLPESAETRRRPRGSPRRRSRRSSPIRPSAVRKPCAVPCWTI